MPIIEQTGAVDPLIATGDLVGFRGAPFPDAVTQAAAESVRSECGWHIAPSVTQTVAVRTGGVGTVLLPSLRVESVALVTDKDGVELTGWDAWENGVLERSSAFPKVILVTLTHGFAVCPTDLLGIIAERASAQAEGRIKSESLAGRSVSLDSGYDPVTAPILARYKLPSRP